MEENKSFMSRVVSLQSELKAPKDQTNTFGKYKYRSCEDILEAAKPLLQKNRIVLTLSDSVEQIGDRYYIKATATLRDVDGDASLSNTAYAREASEKKGMDDSQATGTASSYARKYALNGLLCIDDTKDADTDEYKNQQGGKPTGKSQSGPVCDRCGGSIHPLRKNGEVVKTVEDLVTYTRQQFQMQLCYDCFKKLNGQTTQKQ